MTQQRYALTDIECYQYYVAIKNHIKGRYDFIKYGISGIKESGYNKRKDCYYFYKLSKRLTIRQIVPFLLANFLKDENMFVRDLLDKEAKDNYLDFIKAHTFMFRTFEQDLKELNTFCEDKNIQFQSLFTVKDNQHPIIFRMYLQSLISIETYVIMDILGNIFSKYDDQLKDDFIWSQQRTKLLNYKPFINNINKEKYYEAIKNILHK